MTVTALRALPLELLRRRTSAKWSSYPDDVLPLFVAESDFALAPAITRALERAVAEGDTGYIASRNPLAEAFADFARRRFDWQVDPDCVRSTADVNMGVVEILRLVTQPGERVVVTPPVYPPFYEMVAEAGAVVEDVPLIDTGEAWRLDLAGIERAVASGARAVLLCNPHNPTGTAHTREDLAELARIVAAHDAVVVSDEIHAPLAQPDAGFTPFLSVSDEARGVGFSVTSASKAFNLAGLKCAVMVSAGEQPNTVLRALPRAVGSRTAQFGMIAAVAAFSQESDEWLDSVLVAYDENRRLLAQLLAQHLPAGRYRMPDAGYLAWIDLSAYHWGENPAAHILSQAKVALVSGPAFGAEGEGFVRLNFGTSPEILTEAIVRIASLVEA